MVVLLSGFVLVGPFARTVMTTNELWVDYGYLSCMDGIALGCLAAMVSAGTKFGGKALVALQISGVALSLLITVFRGTAARLAFYKVGLDVTLLGVGTGFLLVALQQRSEQNRSGGALSRSLLAATAPLRWFGRNSYEVYLTHMLVLWPMVGVYKFHPRIDTAPLGFS